MVFNRRVEKTKPTQRRDDMFSFEVCNESTGDYTSVYATIEDGSVASKSEVIRIVGEAFGVVPFGEYSVNTRGKSRIGSFTVYAS
jgi:hypothetical protein